MIDSKEYITKIKQEKPAAMSAFLFIQDYVRFVSLTPAVAPGLLVLAPFLQGLHILFGDIFLFHGLVNQSLVVRQGD